MGIQLRPWGMPAAALPACVFGDEVAVPLLGLQHGVWSLFQGIVVPQVLTGVAANLVNALLNYLFLHQLHFGVM